MAIYEYQGQQYEIETDDPAVAKQKILTHLGKGAEQPAPTPVDTAVPPAPVDKPVVAPRVDVGLTDLAPKSDYSVSPAGLLSAADLVLSTPGFITQTVGALGNVALQGFTTGKVDAKAARQFGTSLAQKLSLVPEAGEKMPGEYLAGKLGRTKEYEKSFVTQTLGNIDKAIESTAQAAQDNGIMDKDVARLVIDSAFVFSPLLRRSKAKPIEGLQPKEVTAPATSVTIVPQPQRAPRKTTDLGVEVPVVPEVNPTSFADSLYSIDNLYKQDLTEAVNLDKMTKDMGIPLDMKEKFRRFDEGQAKGNELIDNQISEVQKQINLLQADNNRLFSEYDYRSKLNPEGTVKDFRSLPEEIKAAISDNYKNIDSLRETIDVLVNKRGTKEELLPYEASVYSRIYLPMKAEIKSLTNELVSMGKAESVKFTEDFASRRIMPKEKSIKEKIVGKDYTEQETGLTYISDAAATRGYKVLENPRNKQRTVVSLGEETPQGTIPITEFKNKKPVRTFEVPKEVFDDPNGKILGRQLKEATVDEINLNMGQKYSPNYNAVMGQRIAELRDQIRRAEWVKELTESPNFNQVGVSLKDYPAYKPLPEGFRTLKYTDKMPELRNYAFENRFAEILDDYNKPASTNPLVRATNTLVTNMMLIPIAHMHNELAHWGITRGVSGFINPVKVGKMLKDFPEAYKEVINRGELYQQILREGGSLMSANVRNSNYLESAFKESADVLRKTPQFKEIAARLGRTPADLYAGISKYSNTSMWTVRDVLYTQLIMEKMKTEGISLKQAIDSVERHMPNYRLPSRIGEKMLGAKVSRMASQALGNRNVFLFSRYHYGMVKSALNTIKDMGMLDKEVLKSKQFKEGIDSALSVVAAMAIVYPMLDQMSQFVTDAMGSNNIEESKVRRAGVLHVFDTIKEVTDSKKDAYALSSILVTMNPVLQTMIELAFNYELYNRREIVNFQDPLATILTDYASFLSRKVPQVGQAVRATDEDYGTGLAGVLLRNFFDIKTRTAEQIDREEKQVERKEAEAFNRELGLDN